MADRQQRVLNRLHPAQGWRRLSRDLALDAVAIGFGVWAGETLGRDFQVKASDAAALYLQVPAAILVGLGYLGARGIYRTVPRYVGLHDTLRVASTGLVLVASLLLLTEARGEATRLGPTLLAGFITATGLVGIRMVERIDAWRRLARFTPGIEPRRTLIVGAGDAGETVMREISRQRQATHQVVGFVDDNAEKANLQIHGVNVLGTSEDIPRLIRDHRIEEVLIAIPSADGANMRRIVGLCQGSSARVRTLPSVSSLLSGGAHLFSYLREVQIEDLLRRRPVRTELSWTTSYLNGESVLITGGGGSIGSELGRQISRLAPASLSLLGKGENSVFEVEQELIREAGFTPDPLICDVKDRQGLESAFRTRRPSIVFHAAAHKHVPLMQANPIEAIQNNVFGTLNAAEMAIRYGAKKFIYVSTDKAVNPSSVMGATKRLGEMIVSALAHRSETEFAVVRFGNVLGSRGSLVPIMKNQIRKGGPVRVTHPDMTRYFMTIPEAVQLILAAGAMGKLGEIFILDMGEPVKIVDLVSDLIRLHGLVPGEDIEIQFTGVRPGEKIHEELTYAEEEVSTSQHPDIKIVGNASHWEWDALREELRKLGRLCEEGDSDGARKLLMELAWGKAVPSLFLEPNARDTAL